MSSAWQLRRLLGFFVAATALPRILAQSCTQVDRLAVQLPRPLQPEFAGFVVPNSVTTAGAPQYSHECLQVTVQGGGDGFDPLAELIADRADVAFVEGEYLARQIAAGSATGLTVVAGYYPHNGLVYVGLEKYASLQDLAFKKIGLLNMYDMPFRVVMDKLEKTVPVTYALQRTDSMSQLESGDLDVATAMRSGELAYPLTWLDPSTNYLRQQNDLFVLDPADHNVVTMHNLAVVKTRYLVNLRARLVKFFHVVTKTWSFCKDNVNACAAVFSDFGEPTALRVWQMSQASRLVFPASAAGMGVVSTQSWNDMNGQMVQLGSIQAAVSDALIDNSVIEEAIALNNASASATQGFLKHFCAPYGSTDYYICHGFEHTYCLAGQMPSGNNDGDCIKCTPGHYSPSASRMNTCEVCPSGTFSEAFGATACEHCKAGRFWHLTNSMDITTISTCLKCPIGRFSLTQGTSECRDCALGYFAESEGQTECYRCLHGSYANTTAATDCFSCLPRQSTVFNGAQSSSECICAEGTYLTLAGFCADCPEGMYCAQDSKESVLMSITKNKSMIAAGQYPRLLPRYWSSDEAPLSIYLCWDENACPGGPPETCGADMEGTACGLCKEGYYRDGKRCLECSGADESPFNYPLLPIIFGPLVIFAVYWLVRDPPEEWKNWRNEVGSLFFLVLITYQMIGLSVAADVEWRKEITSALWPWHYLVDPPDMLRLQCSDYRYFRNRLLVKTTAPLMLMAVFLLTYIICFLVGLGFKNIRTSMSAKSDGTPSGALELILNSCPLDLNATIGLFCSMLYKFYLSLCFISLQLFMCYNHPNGKKSLRYGPEVSCTSEGSGSDWEGMLTEAILSIIFYVALMMVGFGYVVAIAPRHFHDEVFRTRWNFLFRRYKPDCWWWSPLIMIRALLLVLTLVLSEEGSRQLYWMFCMILMYAALLVIFFPWRNRTTNLIDAFSCAITLLFLAMGSTFAKRSDWLDASLARTGAAATFSPIPVVIVLAAWVFYTSLSPRRLVRTKAEESKLASDARASFTKVVALDRPASQAFIQSLSEQDRDTLRSTCALVVAELLGHQPGKAGLQWRLVHQDQRSGASTWAPQPSPEIPPPPREPATQAL